MQRKVYTQEEVSLILDQFAQDRDAQIARNIQTQDQTVIVMELDLNEERTMSNPWKIGVSFKSVFVHSATDFNGNIFTGAKINLAFGSRGLHQKPIPMQVNSSIKSDRYFTDAFFTWTRMQGVKVTVIIFTDAEYDSGQQLQLVTGGTVVTTGIRQLNTRVQVSDSIINTILSQDSNRTQATIQNTSGADIYLGDLTSSMDLEAIVVPDGGVYYHTNTGPLKMIGALDGGYVRIVEEFAT